MLRRHGSTTSTLRGKTGGRKGILMGEFVSAIDVGGGAAKRCKRCGDPASIMGDQPLIVPCRCRWGGTYVHVKCLDEIRAVGAESMKGCKECGFQYLFHPPIELPLAEYLMSYMLIARDVLVALLCCVGSIWVVALGLRWKYPHGLELAKWIAIVGGFLDEEEAELGDGSNEQPHGGDWVEPSPADMAITGVVGDTTPSAVAAASAAASSTTSLKLPEDVHVAFQGLLNDELRPSPDIFYFMFCATLLIMFCLGVYVLLCGGGCGCNGRGNGLRGCNSWNCNNGGGGGGVLLLMLLAIMIAVGTANVLITGFSVVKEIITKHYSSLARKRDCKIHLVMDLQGEEAQLKQIVAPCLYHVGPLVDIVSEYCFGEVHYIKSKAQHAEVV
jgi:hypothetical protein